MEKLKAKYTTLLKAQAQLGKIINKYKTLQEQNTEAEILTVYRDATIKRFDFCYDLTWKYLKLYIEKKFGILVASPKMTFHESLKQTVLTKEQTTLALAMIDDRNETSHTYDEASAETIVDRIPAYFSLMQIIAEQCKP